MFSPSTNSLHAPWNTKEKLLFRFFFLYFIFQIVPLDFTFYQQLFSIKWSRLHYGDIFNLAHYSPRFFSLTGYANWVFAALIALVGTGIWSWLQRHRTVDYTTLYYWLRVLVRYRLAVGIIAYGFIKIFPLQSPWPSISNLNTAYGDFNRWKLFALSLGIVPSYESFLGFVEVILGLLLLYRKTAPLSAFIILVFTGNVFVSNIAYEGGETVYSLYLISLALFLLSFDLQRIIRLLILQKPTSPNRFQPSFLLPWQQYGRLALKTVFILFFVVLYGVKTGTGYYADRYQYPTSKGLSVASPGIYHVKEFRINNDTIPYSTTHPVRWQDVVFEEWNTISIRSNRPVIIDSTNTDQVLRNEQERNYELEGTGGRHYYRYEVDTLNRQLTLHNKNKHYAAETLILKYQAAGDSLIVQGVDERKDSLYAVLNKLNKKYLLEEAAKYGRNSRLKL